eukprot:m.53810 g.53810  ORF g.53810 m.53810 type:complete len:1144 (+) comp15468_c0_seq1:92-3523(+)
MACSLDDRDRYTYSPALAREVYIAAGDGDTETVKNFLQDNLSLVHSEYARLSPLQIASRHGHTTTARTLLQYNGDVNAATTNLGMTALHFVASYGHHETMQLLLDYNANIEATDNNGATPLHDAVSERHELCVENLLAVNANVNVTNNKEEPPLHHAASTGDVACAQKLLDANATIGVKDQDGNTCLHVAAINGHGAVVDVIMRRQPDPAAGLVEWIKQFVDAANGNGQSAAASARSNGYSRLAETIEQHKREVLLLQDGGCELTENKLLVCGFSGVGKTTLVQALEYKQTASLRLKHTPLKLRLKNLKGTKRTAGFDVRKFVIPLAGDAPWTVIDFAGHTEYYITHELLLDSKNAIFIVMCNLYNPWELQRKDIEYWLQFITTKRMDHDRSADSDNKLRVLLVGSHKDTCGAERLALLHMDWKQKIKELQTRFHGKLDIEPEMQFVTCTKAGNSAMRLHQTLGTMRKEVLDNHRMIMPRLVFSLDKTLRLKATQDQLGRITTVDKLTAYVQQQHSVECSQKQMVMVLGYLNHIGTILYFANVATLHHIIVLDPQWFGLNVLGRVLAPNEDDLADGQMPLDTTDASIRCDTFREFMVQHSRGHKYAAIPSEHVDDVLNLLQHLQVCSKVDGKHLGKTPGLSYLIFPAMLLPEETERGMLSTLPRARPIADSRPMVLGIRLQCDDDCYLIPTGLFPKLQVCLQNEYENNTAGLNIAVLRISFHTLYFRCADDTEAVMEMSTKTREYRSERPSLDIIVWCYNPRAEHCGSCKVVLDRLTRLCEEQQQNHHYGHIALTPYILDTCGLVPCHRSLLPANERVVACSAASVQERVNSMGHGYSLLDFLVRSQRLVELAGVQLRPPLVNIRRTDQGGRQCSLSTVYEHGSVEVWYSLDRTLPERGSPNSIRSLGGAFPIGIGTRTLRAAAYFHTAVPSPVVEVEWTDLHTAAQTGDVARLTELLRQHLNVNAIDLDSTTPLSHAARNGHVVCVQKLIDAHANVNASDLDGSTALHLAASNNYTNVVDALLHCGANPNAVTQVGNTPLHCSAIGGNVDTLKSLLLGNAAVGRSNIDGDTALHMAARQGHVEVVRLLMASNADCDAANNIGDTPTEILDRLTTREQNRSDSTSGFQEPPPSYTPPADDNGN